MAEVKLNLDVQEGFRFKSLMDELDARVRCATAQAEGFRIGIETAKKMIVDYLAKEKPSQE